MTENMTRTPEEFSPTRQWFGLLAGPVTWIVHFVVLFSIADFGCVTGGNRLRFSDEAIVILSVILTVLFILIPLAGAWVSYRDLRRIPREKIDEYMKLDRAHFMAWVGLASSLSFAVIMVITIIPSFFSSCQSIVS